MSLTITAKLTQSLTIITTIDSAAVKVEIAVAMVTIPNTSTGVIQHPVVLKPGRKTLSHQATRISVRNIDYVIDRQMGTSMVLTRETATEILD